MQSWSNRQPDQSEGPWRRYRKRARQDVHDMVSARSEVERLFEALAMNSPYPDTEPEDVQNDWMELMSCDAIVAGLLSTALSGGRVSAANIGQARELLNAHASWRQRWPDHVGYLSRACEVLPDFI